jgi:hypothetical protein
MHVPPPTTHHSTLINTRDTFPNDRLITSNDAQTVISMPRSPWYTIDPRLPTLPATATSTSSRNRPKIDDEAAAAQPFYFFSSIPLLPLCHSLSPPVHPSLFPKHALPCMPDHPNQREETTCAGFRGPVLASYSTCFQSSYSFSPRFKNKCAKQMTQENRRQCDAE